MLTLKNITVAFGDKIVLDSISCEILSGDFITIVGANGAGKTTLFDVIAGIIKPTKGTVTLDSTGITCWSEQKRALIISRLFQNPQVNSVSSMTVRENLALALYKGQSAGLVSGTSKLTQARARELLEPFGLYSERLLETPMGQLSGGQRQLIAFIMATVYKPKILLLDEPTAALDPTAATKLLLAVATYVKEHSITTLLITHDPQVALALGNKLWVLDQGRISKQFNNQEKSGLNPEQLIGQINYQLLRDTVI